jgi:hypothetical protein
MSDDKTLTPEEQEPQRDTVSVDGDDNVVGDDNNVAELNGDGAIAQDGSIRG